MTKGIPTDPGLASQWHLTGTWGLQTQLVWPDYTGAGVLVGVMDDGVQHTHPDLTVNYRADLDYDALGNDNDANINVAAGDKHGTAVAGVIAADDNGSGYVGVAFDASIVGLRIGFGAGSDVSDILDSFNHALTAGLDIVNNSWGFPLAFSDDNRLNFTGTDISEVTDALATLSEQGRDGLGTILVFSAGNSRAAGENVNYHNFQNSPYSITVAAIKADGMIAPFSNPGAAVLVSAGGNAVMTTDVTGTAGYGSADTASFSGTSASAPVVSGAVAQMLEANGNLGWRDVQEILAYSAAHNHASSTTWQRNGAENWNGGGLYFSHDYGFGAVDAHAAVRLAETWTVQQTTANMVTSAAFNASPNIAIPATGTITTSINVGANIDIEHVLINLDIAHTKAGDLEVTLISPDGTRSVLVDNINNGAYTASPYGQSGIHFDMSSNAHWGEQSAGTWTLEVKDTTAGNAGTLNGWGLQFMGGAVSANDTYIYTDDFLTINTSGRKVLSDTDGGVDTLNFAAMTVFGIHANLADNAAFSVQFKNSSGQANPVDIDIATGTIIENIFTGDGADVVQGNGANNEMRTGRGNDTLSISGGDDILNGGAGIDMGLMNGCSLADFTCVKINANTLEFTHKGGVYGKDRFIAVENFTFLEGVFTFAQVQDYYDGVLSPPPGSGNGVGLTFGMGTKSYNYTSTANEVKTLTGAMMAMGTATAKHVTIDRNGSDLKLNYLATNAPEKLKLTGGDGDERVTILGQQKKLMTDINLGGGNDSLTISVALATSLARGGDGNDTLTGNIGKDVLYGDAGNDTLRGGAGDDTLHGGDGNDLIEGEVGNDILNGGAGNDTINGGDGNDTLNGDDGNDTLNGGKGNDILYGFAGDDLIYGDVGLDKIFGGDGHDTIYGGADIDTINGDAGNDIIYGEAANDIVNGGLGNDTLYGGDGNDTLNGDAGDDIINGDIGADILNGGDGNDTINGGAGIDKISGGNGDDALNGGNDVDTINGDAGNDTINGDAGNDILSGGAGNDTMNGGIGLDKMNGNDGNDIMDGGDDADTIYGDAGNDIIYGGRGADKLYGGADDDIIYGGLDADLIYGDAGNDTLYGDAGADVLYGLIGNDTIYGGSENDKIYGGDGNDRIFGDAGNDMLYGDNGDDLIVAGSGADLLYGGAGNDVFAFTAMDGVDSIKDFRAGDRINISDLLTGFSGNLDDLDNFVRIATAGTTRSFAINADGIGNDFVTVFNVTGLSGTLETLANSGVLITDQPVL